MAKQDKLERWAERLLDTGKRNNLINYKDTKTSSAEVVYPDCVSVFEKCTVGYTFEVYDPKIIDDDINDIIDEETQEEQENKLGRDEYIDKYSAKVKKAHSVLIYAQTPNPMTAVRNIAKKAKGLLDETGINAAYLAFGFIRWNEKEGSNVFYRAPLLLVHVNILSGSIVEPVKIEISDDDVVVNPTFDYYLQASHGMSLPEYKDEDTITSYFGKVSTLVKKMGWSVLSECKLGTFAFQKLNMYEDLKNNADKVLANDNIKALMGDPSDDNEKISESTLDCHVNNPLIELHTVVGADSSQIEAIEMAKSGKSFVLQGPPGTGKSQTITNIIAECLHDGKRVLFVSEKQAALNVVYDKLKKVDLTDFCLELHSHKANKKAVIEELNRTLEMPKSKVSPNAQEEIRKKEEAQTKLDRYAITLHQKRSVIQKSLYQLFELYSEVKNSPEIQFYIKGIEKKGLDYLETSIKYLEQYAEYVPMIGQDYKTNYWYGFNQSSISFDERNQLRQDMPVFVEGFRKIQQVAEQIEGKYSLPKLNYNDAKWWQKLLEYAGKSEAITPALLNKEILDKAVPNLQKLEKMSSSIIPLRQNILAKYKSELLEQIDGKEVKKKLTEQYSGTFSRLFKGEYKRLIGSIQAFSINGGKIKYPEAIELTDKIQQLQDLNRSFAEYESNVIECMGPCYNGVDTDWNYVINEINVLQEFFSARPSSFESFHKMSRDEFYKNQSAFREEANNISDAYEYVLEAKERIKEYFSTDVVDFDNDSLEKCRNKIDGCISTFDALGNWINFTEVLKQLEAIELKPYIEAIIDNHIEPKDVVGVYRKMFYKQWIEYIIFTDQTFSSFSRIKQDQTVRNFVEKDNLQYEISKHQIRSELSLKRPDLGLVAGGSAVSILRREGRKKRKQMPIRKLLSEIGDLVQIIKPCFLMSPLSVSTFLDPDKISFDTVIFDEASQIFPQDAIGAIYRGKQLIVVGDSKQMPPSNFFNSSMETDTDDEESGDVTDFESILDICSTVFNTERLSWHYRSHYEQLIAFSNTNFYRNNLITFPSSSKDHKWIGVDYYFAGGIFDRKSKTNWKEAEFVVNLVYENIKRFPNRSLGVVAFSASQQNLIDRLLSKRREEDTSYEWFFKEDNPEPFFVKNLETVQGDERDTIIFSVAYAKDSQGRFIHNFGPLNRVGGERRLNVAVTRAKDNVQLVASIHYTDINLNNTGSEGARLLRSYLEYAQNGEEALERSFSAISEDHYDSYFEQEVCDYLRDNGFDVDTQVGCSGYKIDLGVRLPNTSNYILAIECDGATYHGFKNARDRDSLRQSVLESMGWSFYRIWSTDWYKNTSVEKEQLLKAVNEAIERNKISNTDSKETKNKTDNSTEIIKEQFVTEALQSSTRFPEYKEVDALGIIRKARRYNFQEGIHEILETEAPMSEEYLLKRIVPFFGREKVTKVVINDFDSLMTRCTNWGIIRKGGFLYLKDSDNYTLRIPGEKRDIKYIAPEELADGLYTLIKQNVTITRDSLYKLLTNILGFNRTGESIVLRYNDAMKYLRRRKLIVVEGDVISARDN